MGLRPVHGIAEIGRIRIEFHFFPAEFYIQLFIRFPVVQVKVAYLRFVRIRAQPPVSIILLQDSEICGKYILNEFWIFMLSSLRVIISVTKFTR